MNIKQFNLIAIAILIISLIYVPTILDNGNVSSLSEWLCIFSFPNFHYVDFSRLILEELAIGLLLYGLWQFVSKK